MKLHETKKPVEGAGNKDQTAERLFKRMLPLVAVAAMAGCGPSPGPQSDAGPAQDAGPVADAGPADSGPVGTDAGPDSNAPCPGTSFQNISQGFHLDSQVNVGGYGFTYKGQVSGGIEMDISCVATGTLLYSNEPFMVGVATDIPRPMDGFTITVTNNSSAASWSNNTVVVK